MSRNENVFVWNLNTHDFSIFVIAADGTCIVSPVISPGKHSAIGTSEEFASGAAEILLDCVGFNPHHVGGSARNLSKSVRGPPWIVHKLTKLGGDESLNAIIFGYNPSNVLCGSSIPGPSIESSCYNILETMPYDVTPRVFGTAGRGVDVALPKTFTSRK